MEKNPYDLSDRELEVMRYLAGGFGNKQIAAVMDISESTVEYHLGNIYKKLNVGSRTEAVAMALREGWY